LTKGRCFSVVAIYARIQNCCQIAARQSLAALGRRQSRRTPEGLQMDTAQKQKGGSRGGGSRRLLALRLAMRAARLTTLPPPRGPLARTAGRTG